MKSKFGILAGLACALLAVAEPGSAQLPAWERWWTFETTNFRVHYADGLEEVARRSAEIAEDVHGRLSVGFVDPPRGPIELVITDHTDFANGFATPIPRNRIVVFSRPPTDETTLAYFDEWLHLLVGHELVHIFHLDHAGAGWPWLRRVFGRSPLFFPQLFTPAWLLEGLATELESELTGAGRVHGTHFDMVLRTAALADRLFPIDRVSGVPSRWPGAGSTYSFGSHFFEWIKDEYGAEARGDLVRELGRIPFPYLVERPARRVLDDSFTGAWNRWRSELSAEAEAWAAEVRARGETVPEVVLPPDRLTTHPRHLDGGRIVFTRADGRREMHLAVLGADGRVRRIAPRSATDAVSADPSTGEMYWTDLEYRDRVSVQGDVFSTRGGAGRHRVTRGARIRDLDLHLDGGAGVAIRGTGGVSVPVLVDLGSGEVREIVPPDRSVHWIQPRWAPDGERFAVARWRESVGYDIVILTPGGTVVESFGAFGSVSASPAWSPDGAVIVYAADPAGTMNLYARDLSAGRDYRVTDVVTGAFQPDVSPDGRSIVFGHYGAEGYGISRVPFAPDAWEEIVPAARPFPAPPAAHGVPFEPRPYRAVETALPTTWVPLLSLGTELGFGVGAALGGIDAIGRHQYLLDATVHPAQRHLDGRLSYWFEGWRPVTPEIGAAQRWSVRQSEPEDPDGEPIGTAILEVSRGLSAALAFRRPGSRASWFLRTGADVRSSALRWQDPEAPGTIGLRLREPSRSAGAFASLMHSTARRQAFSISAETGATTALRLDLRRFQAGETQTRVQGQVAAFTPLDLGAFARHVLAVRLAGGVEGGRRAGFSAGGAPGRTAGLPMIPGLEPLPSVAYPVRGYPTGAQVGDRVVSGSAELRIPLAFVERGIRTLPVFLDRVWAAGFTDAGSAWCARCPEGWGTPAFRPLVSAGAELAARIRLGYHADTDLRFGVAVPLVEGGGRSPGEVEVYFRLGQAF